MWDPAECTCSFFMTIMRKDSKKRYLYNIPFSCIYYYFAMLVLLFRLLCNNVRLNIYIYTSIYIDRFLQTVPSHKILGRCSIKTFSQPCPRKIDFSRLIKAVYILIIGIQIHTDNVLIIGKKKNFEIFSVWV